jgi:hypothetical protein
LYISGKFFNCKWKVADLTTYVYSFQCDNTLERGMHLLKKDEEEEPFGVKLSIE